MTQYYGEISLNGRKYKMDISSYKEKDMTDFSPRASTPGGSITKSELMLYQPVWQYDWRHGFGWVWHEDASGYLRTEGNIDTRHDSLVMMMTKSTISDVDANDKHGMVEFNGNMYSYGAAGLRRFGRVENLHAPAKLTASVPLTTYTIQPDENASTDAFISEAATGTNYGDSVIITVGHYSTKIRRGFLDFYKAIMMTPIGNRVSNGMVISTASLFLTVVTNRSTGVPVLKVFRTRRAWTESYINWLRYAGPALLWTTAGAGSTADDYENTEVGTKTIAAPVAAGGVIEIPLDGALLTTCLYARTYTGLLLKMNAESNDAYDFASARDADPLKRPKLVLNMTTAGNVDVGLHSYKVTLYDAMGETEGGAASDFVTVSGSASKVYLTNIPVGPAGTVGRKIYRTKAGDATKWYYVGLIADNTTTIYTDDTADVSLGAQVPTTNTTVPSYDSWAEVYTTYPVNHAIATKNYLLFCPDGSRLQKMDTSEVITDAGVNSSAADFKQLLLFEGFIFGFVDGTNQVHYSEFEDISSMSGVTTDPNIMYCGSSGNTILGLLTYGTKLYAATRSGLWVLSDDKKVFRMVLDYFTESSASNFASTVTFNGLLFYTIRDRIYSWNAARYNEVTPRKLTDTFPYILYGNFSNFVESDGFLYCTGRTNETTYTESLLCFDGVGWHKLMDLITDGIGSVSMLAIDTLNSKLWYHISGNQEETYYIPLSAIGDYPYADFPTTGTHGLYTSRIEAGYREVIKSSPSLEVQVSNVTATRYISVYYSLDGGAWTFWSNLTTNGVTKLTTPGGLRTVEYKYIQLKFIFVTDTATQTPIFEGYVLRMLMRPNEFYGWNFNISVATSIESMEGEDSRSSYDIASDLRTARASKAPIEMIDLFGTSRYGYLSSLTFLGVELHPDESNPRPNVELVANVNWVEVL